AGPAVRHESDVADLLGRVDLGRHGTPTGRQSDVLLQRDRRVYAGLSVHRLGACGRGARARHVRGPVAREAGDTLDPCSTDAGAPRSSGVSSPSVTVCTGSESAPTASP